MRFSFATACRGVAAIIAAAILATPAGAQGGPAFGRPSAGNNITMVVSDDKKAWAALLDGLGTQLDRPGAPLFATRVFSISMSLAGAEKGVKFGVYLEGHVFHTKGMDISLVTT